MVKCCFRHILEIVEKLLEFLLRNSYIIIALEGTGIVPSGKRAAKLLKEYLVDVISLNVFGDTVISCARIFIAFLAGILCWSLMYNVDEITLIQAPAIIAAIIGFFIIHCFLDVFEMGVDTVFVCFCVDFGENYGQDYYMSPKLMETMTEMKEFTGGWFNFGTNQNQKSEAPPQPQVFMTNVQNESALYTQQPHPYENNQHTLQENQNGNKKNGIQYIHVESIA